MAQTMNFIKLDIISFIEGGENMEKYLEESGEKKKFVIKFKEGTSVIFNKLSIEKAQERARKENKKKPVAVLAEITPSQGAIPIEF